MSLLNSNAGLVDSWRLKVLSLKIKSFTEFDLDNLESESRENRLAV